jgi:hypothetical protein
MQVTINVPEQLAELAHSRGVAVEIYIEEVLARESQQAIPKDIPTISAAIDQLRELSKGNKLDGLKIKDLINEGRKY